MMFVRVFATVLAGAAVLGWPSAPAIDVPSVAVRAAAGPADLWLAPEADVVAARADLARAVSDLSNGRAADALAVFQAAAADPVVGGYARLFAGRAELALKRPADAVATARRLLGAVEDAPGPGPRAAGEAAGRRPRAADDAIGHGSRSADDAARGYLREAALWLAADAATAASDPKLAAWALGQLASLPGSASAPAIGMKLGRAWFAAGDVAGAVAAFARVYAEWPLSAEAKDAASELARIAPAAMRPSRATSAALLGRAERLFAGRQFTDARAAFDSLKPFTTGDDRARIDLRLAQCDYGLKRYALSVASLRALVDRQPPARAAEAEYYYLGALRETGRTAEYADRLAAFLASDADAAFVQRALYDLAQFHVFANDDGKAAEVFADLYRRYPQGLFAERAAWKSGWWAYRTGRYADTVAIFESAADGLGRADFRPAWLYWAARAHARLGQAEAALDGYARTIALYRNSYYGRAALRARDALTGRTGDAADGFASPMSTTRDGLDAPPPVDAGARPANADLIQALLAAGMYDEALGELRLLQSSGSSSPLVDATVAFALNRQGLLRPAILAMRRAYPQFIAAGGEALPTDILSVIFPVAYWEPIQRHAEAAGLDRHLIAALVAQESTFQADIRSSANAWGLMQILPSTGRLYATRLGLRPFTTNRLTNPDVNLQIGTAFFTELLARFGDAAPALAAYNAGPSRVVQWLAERPGLDREEFIDDIPYPETQNYVKRILGTAEDYRRLYR